MRSPLVLAAVLAAAARAAAQAPDAPPPETQKELHAKLTAARAQYEKNLDGVDRAIRNSTLPAAVKQAKLADLAAAVAAYKAGGPVPTVDEALGVTVKYLEAASAARGTVARWYEKELNAAVKQGNDARAAALAAARGKLDPGLVQPDSFNKGTAYPGSRHDAGGTLPLRLEVIDRQGAAFEARLRLDPGAANQVVATVEGVFDGTRMRFALKTMERGKARALAGVGHVLGDRLIIEMKDSTDKGRSYTGIAVCAMKK